MNIQPDPITVNQSEQVIQNTVVEYNTSELSKYVKEVKLMPGLSIAMAEVPAQSGFTTGFNVGDGPVEMLFCLSGGSFSEICCGGERKEFLLCKGECAIARLRKASGTSSVNKNQKYKIINIFISQSVLSELLSGMENTERLLSSIMQPESDYFMNIKPVTKTIEALINDVENSLNSEKLNKMLLVAKVYELITASCSHFSAGSAAGEKSVLQPEDIKGIVYVGEMLLSCLSSPPSIKELSRMAGVNDYKLKSGFKEVYGTTVYNYIRRNRMEQARKMLESGSKSVSEIAWDLGYTNVSHFISLFRKQYGVYPGKYLSEIRRTITQSAISCK